MERVTVAVEPPYDALVGPGALAEAGPLLAARRRVAIVTQERVATLHAPTLQGALDAVGVRHALFLMGEGEPAKSLRTVEDLCRRFAASGLLRDDAVVALGGGVVGDTAGFAAAVYHRGVAVVQAPTTLLAMVDAAIGGKTAVNVPEGKNLVGAFHQPLAVLADPSTLATLPEREYRSGLGEVAKYALLADAGAARRFVDAGGTRHGGELVSLVHDRPQAVLARDPGVVSALVTCCAALKAAVVAQDPQERTGARAVLNLGHTFAHALETARGYDLTHGEAVAVGLVFAGALAGACERVPAGVVERYRQVPAWLGLPTRVPERSGLDVEGLLALMGRDKKARGGLSFVLPGPAGIERVDDPPEAALRHAFAAVGLAPDAHGPGGD